MILAKTTEADIPYRDPSEFSGKFPCLIEDCQGDVGVALQKSRNYPNSVDVLYIEGTCAGEFVEHMGLPYVVLNQGDSRSAVFTQED